MAVPKLKLFFIIENDEPHSGAGGFYAPFKFAEFLALRGHNIFVYSVHNMQWVNEQPKLKIRYRPSVSRKTRVLAKLDRTLARVSDKLFLESAIRQLKPDWILGVLTYSAIKAEALGRRYGIPVANFIYECPPWMQDVWGLKVFQANSYPYTTKLWEKTRRAYLGSKILFPNSSLSQKYNTSWLSGKTVESPIHPGIDPNQMPFASPQVEPILLNAKSKHLLFVGRLVESKNVQDLISAFPLLSHGVELHICGLGPELEKLKLLAKNFPPIHFYGYLPDSKLWSLFRQCDLVVYPTSFEGFGMPPMQALYFAKPCIASDLEVFKSVFGNALDYFPLRDFQSLATSINSLLANPEYCRARGAEGRKFILENFTWDIASQNIERALIGV